ncbi:inner membrane CreD family protein [Thiofilum flexile]|uniref:inner membrane CreD family protein n=1 Tax=Thiofilum flexile TaxID=125627 RepID=UPI000476B3EA|nr:inner membrane CreD family protein [Thiofilum flexile]
MMPSFLSSLSARIGLVVWAGFISALLLAATVYYLQQAPKSTPTHQELLKPQHITAPLLVIPYVEHFVSVETVTDKDGTAKVMSKDVYTDHTTVLLPLELYIRTTLNTDKTALVIITGKFDYQPLTPANPDNERNIRWDKAQLLVGIKDLTALQDPIKVFWNNDHLDPQADTQALPGLGAGFHILLPETKEQARIQNFEIQLPLQLGNTLSFTPVGQKNELTMSIPNTLNIQNLGARKPLTKVANANNYLWTWQIPALIRGYPNAWIQDQTKPFDLHQAPFGIEQKQTNPLEMAWGRLMQWCFPLLGLVLGVALVLELLSGRTLHWVHYTLLGTSISLMYLLIMALEALFPFTRALQLSMFVLVGFNSVILSLLLGRRALVIASGLYAGVVISFYYLITAPVYGILGLVMSAGVLGLLLILGSIRYLHPSESADPELDD